MDPNTQTSTNQNQSGITDTSQQDNSPVMNQQDDGLQATTQQIPSQQTPQTTPVPNLGGPVGTMHKEAGPSISQVEYTMTPSNPLETAPELDQEVKEAGVEHVVDPTELHLTEEHADAGIEQAKESVPVLQTQKTPIIPKIKNAQFTQSEAVEIVKHTSTNDAKHWVAVLLVMLYKKARLITSFSQSEQKAT